VRILYVSHSFPLPGDPTSNVGGMQRVATGLHAALARHPGVELSSLLLETSWKATPYRMPGYLSGLLARIPRIVRRERTDVVLFSSMVTASLSVALRRAVRRQGAIMAAIPVGRDVTLPTPPYQWLVPRIFGALDVAFPISRATARECLRRGLPPQRMRIVPCGVDAQLFGAPGNRLAARHALLAAIGESPATIPDDALLLCSVGRHQARKGFQWFADEVMPRLPRDVFYLVTGAGPMTPRIREAVERRGVGENVRLLGPVSEEVLRTLYGGADLFVMPNIPVAGDIEGFGVVMLEAGLCGLPVLAADLEGISDVIRDGENGHLLPPRDAAAFAAEIEVYRADRARLAEASGAAAAYTARHFGWPAIADLYVRILNGFVQNRGAAPAELARAAS
jgi:phosphatidyl-myo-inositol dimannoside synthase